MYETSSYNTESSQGDQFRTSVQAKALFETEHAFEMPSLGLATLGSLVSLV